MKFYDCMLRTMDKFGVEKGHQPTDALFYVLEGDFDLKVDGKTIKVKQNDLVAFPKNVEFERRITNQLKFYYVKLKFDYDISCDVLPVKNKMRLLSSLMFMLEASKSENNKALAEYFLNDIFMQIDAEKNLISVSKDPLIEEIIQFFKENIKENVSLEILINKFGISKSGLIKRFNDVTGFTPMQYLSNLRLKEAEELLITSDLTLSQIADNCGFDNAFYLSNAFKKVKGTAPRYFREKHRI